MTRARTGASGTAASETYKTEASHAATINASARSRPRVQWSTLTKGDAMIRWIESIDVSGTAASAKIVLDHPAGRFVDYMSLLEVGGKWKIVHKIFHREPRP